MEQEQAEPTFDFARLRAIILAFAIVWMTLDEVQREVVAVREKLGEKPEHVPLQIVEQCLTQLVEQGGVIVKAEKDKPKVYRLNRQPLIARRAAILERLLHDPYHENSAHEHALREETGATASDIEELVQSGFLVRLSVLDSSVVRVALDVVDEIKKRGCEAVVALGIPADPEEKAVGENFAAKALEKAEEAESRAKVADVRFERIRQWLADKGINDVSGIIDPPPAKPPRHVFDFTETRKINDAEKGHIFDEVMKLEQDKALVQLRMDGAVSQCKGEIKKLDAEIAALKSSAQCSERVVTTLAYKDVDWTANAEVVRAVADDRELERKPIPKGTQKAIPGADKAEVSAAAQRPTGDEKPRLEDIKGAVLQRVGQGGATFDDIAVFINGGYADVPEGVEGLVKVEVHQLLKAKAVARDKKTGVITLLPQPGVAAAANDDTPGPLADEKTKREYQRKKKANGAAEVAT